MTNYDAEQIKILNAVEKMRDCDNQAMSKYWK